MDTTRQQITHPFWVQVEMIESSLQGVWYSCRTEKGWTKNPTCRRVSKTRKKTEEKNTEKNIQAMRYPGV